jgi:hypothetical protein
VSEVPDQLAALRAFLKADADLTAITQGRIFAGELPASVTPAMPTTAVVISRAGGLGAIGRAYQQYGDFRVDVRCYGATPKAADDVWRRLQPALKQLRRQVVTGCLLHWARQGGGPMPMRDPDTDWPSIFSAWQVLAAEIPVPA